MFDRITEKEPLDEKELFRDVRITYFTSHNKWMHVFRKGLAKKKGKLAWSKRYLILHQVSPFKRPWHNIQGNTCCLQGRSGLKIPS